MLLTASEMSSKGSLHWWFCLRAHAKREHLAAAYLRQHPEVEAFCPRVRFRKRTTRGPIWFVEPMFPGYLLLDLTTQLSIGESGRGRGIRGFVQFAR
jgi:transcriptional antiterminator RfaH